MHGDLQAWSSLLLHSIKTTVSYHWLTVQPTQILQVLQHVEYEIQNILYLEKDTDLLNWILYKTDLTLQPTQENDQ